MQYLSPATEKAREEMLKARQEERGSEKGLAAFFRIVSALDGRDLTQEELAYISYADGLAPQKEVIGYKNFLLACEI